MPEHKPAAAGWWVVPDRWDGIPVHLRKEGFFVPKPLPSSLALDQTTQHRRGMADHALGRLHEAAAGLPDRNVLVRPTQHHEIQSMLAFQNMVVTNREIASVDLPEQVVALRPPYNVARYLRAMGAAMLAVREIPVGEVLKQVARELADEDELPWRTEQWLSDEPDNPIVAVPPGADLRVATEQLFEWIDSPTEMPVIDKAALGAYQLFTLHPFTNSVDLLHVYVILELVGSGAVQDQIVPVAVHIDRNMARFRQVHRQIVLTGEYDDLVRFFADGIAEQCENQLRVVHRLAKLPRQYMAKVDPKKRKDGFARLMGVLPGFQIVSVELIAAKCEVTPKHARELLARAERLDIIDQVGNRKRNRIYEVRDVRRALDRYAGIVPETDRAVTEK